MLIAKNLSFSYPGSSPGSFLGRTILSGVSLTLSEGERLGISGDNGVGKSTLLSILSACVRPQSGQLFFKGQEVFSSPREYRFESGYAPEVPYLYDALTPKEHLRFCCGMFQYSSSQSRERIAELVDQFHLAEIFKQPCGSLSKGQAQRVNLALALAHQPSVVFLDEPFSGLDQESYEAMIKLFRTELSELTIVMTSHSEQEMAQCCTSRTSLVSGRLKAPVSIESNASHFQNVVGG